MSEPIDKDTRGATNLRIKFRSANLDEFIERYAVDISRGGIFIRTREPLSVNSRLRLDFQLLDAQPLLEGEGTVVWIRQPDPSRAEVTPGMGVRFDKLSPDSQTRLDKILAEKERLGQAGKAPGMTKTGGMAVRRPTGAFAPIDTAAAAKVAPPTLEVSAGAAEAKPPAPPPAPEAPRFTAPFTTAAARAAGPATGFGRPRTTTGGLSALRSAPVPSALFEQPTADDIDRALSVLEEKPGPVPPMPPPRPPQDVPIHVADESSNEPTRVVSDPQEFAVHEAITGKGAEVLPEADGANDGVPMLEANPVDDETRRATDADEEATMAASPAAFAAAERVLSGGVPSGTPDRRLDAPLAAHLKTIPPVPSAPTPSPAVPAPAAASGPVVAGPAPASLRKKGIVVDVPVPTESGRFRTSATYRRPRKAAKRTAVAVVLVVALGGAGFAMRHRLHALLAPPPPRPTEAAAPAAPPPGAAAPGATPGTTPPAGATPPPGPPAPVVEGPSPPPEPAKEAANAPAKEAAAADTQKPAPEKQAAAEERPRKKRRAAAAVEGEGAKPVADKPAPAGDKPAEAAADKAAPAGDKPAPAGDKPEAAAGGGDAPAAPAPEAAAPAPAAAPPLLKVTSSPTGAEVIIDGNSVGTTPFSSKEIDPSAAHAITVKKDGYEAGERNIAAADWSRSKKGPSLKVSIKLRRAGAAEAPKEEPKKDPSSEVEIITPD
jgi:uncharacterized protein (TIGR02266 family)